MKEYILGIDVGGTKIEAALLEISDETTLKNIKTSSTDIDHFAIPSEYFKSTKEITGSICARKRIPTDRHKGYQSVMENMKNLVLEVCQMGGVSIDKLQGIGIGLPGTIHPERQVMLNGNTSIFIEKNMGADLNAILPIKTKIQCENDATCFALAEALCGAGQKYREESGRPVKKHIAIGIIMGTGLGGGIFAQGQILRGKNGGCGELGHSELINNGRRCYCGFLGCTEQYLAGPAIEAIFKEKSGNNLRETIEARDIFAMASSAQNSLAKEVIKEHQENFVRFLTKLTNIFDPDYFVLGGGVSKQAQIYQGTEEMLKKQTFVPQANPKIYQHCLGDSAGVIGAAMLLLMEN